MSSGLELIPLAIVGIAHLASRVKKSLEEAEQTGRLRVETRMANRKLVESSLLALGYNITKAGAGFAVSTGEGVFTMDESASGAWFAECASPAQFDHVTNALLDFEAEYLRQLQALLVEEINQNAVKLGMTVQEERLPDHTVRLSVIVGGA
jgi:hypothetical protein